MKRYHLFEFEDLPWFPDVIRTGGTDFLRYLLIVSELYLPVIRLLGQTMAKTGQNILVDLCSGGGGYMEQVYQELKQTAIPDLKVILTDKFPNLNAYRLLHDKTGGGITFAQHSVDAMEVPAELKGMRVMFSAAHHFQPEQIREVLQNSVHARAPIALIDGGDKHLGSMLAMLIFHPIAFALFTPFFRPFKWSRLLFTYLIPLIPLYTIWDGLVSVLRFYEPKEWLTIAQSIPDSGYEWKSGKTVNRFGLHAAYLIGYPVVR